MSWLVLIRKEQLSGNEVLGDLPQTLPLFSLLGEGMAEIPKR